MIINARATMFAAGALAMGCLAAATANGEEDAIAELRSEVQEYEVRLNGEAIELQPGPLYTYDEVIDNWLDGSCWVWGGEGRPAVLMNTMVFGTSRWYEFISLSNETVEVDTQYGVSWRPKPSWEPTPFEDAPPPAANSRLRLIQMRALARQFGVRQSQPELERMRLLPQPIYRYPSETEESLDGAIFAFLREGDLETLLTLEAVKDGDATGWKYDLKRVSVDYQIAQLNDQQVWEVPRIEMAEAYKKDATFFITHRRGLTIAPQAPVDP